MPDAGTGQRHVQHAPGRHARLRRAAAWCTQLVFFGLPWLHWNTRPLLLLDFSAQRFQILGTVFWPQDGIYLVALLLCLACALVLAGSVLGRSACAYACPHTVYSGLFLWLERRIEGTRGARIRLERAPLSVRKAALKAGKHGAWLLLSAWIGLTLVAYMTPAPVLAAALFDGALHTWQVVLAGAYAMLAYCNAGWMRERLCSTLCPLGSWQGAMLDPDTLVVTYNAARGEPRALRNRKHLATGALRGDCVDCSLCVQVCPTGSDIRRGLAHDCIGCGACIDACDGVMDKLGLARGLVGYARLRAAGPAPRKRARVLTWIALLGLSMTALGVALWQRVPLELSVQRERAMVTRAGGAGLVENRFVLHMINTDARAHRYLLRVDSADGVALGPPRELVLGAGAHRQLVLAVRASWRRPGAYPIVFSLRALDAPAIAVQRGAVLQAPDT